MNKKRRKKSTGVLVSLLLLALAGGVALFLMHIYEIDAFISDLLQPSETASAAPAPAADIPEEDEPEDEPEPETVRNVIENLSVDAGSDYFFSQAENTLSKTGGEDEDEAALLSAIMYYAVGKGSREKLDNVIKAIDKAGAVDKDFARTCRIAAEGCNARWETAQADAIFSFVGDCTFGRINESNSGKLFPKVFERSGSPTYPFDFVRTVFTCDDLTVINFEGTLTTSKHQADKQWRFRGDPEYAKILPLSSVEAATLANNHSIDYHEQGLKDTEKYLKAEGVGTFRYDDVLVKSIETKNGTFEAAFIGCSFTITKEKIKNMLASVDEHKRAGRLVVVVLHWGKEYTDKPVPNQVELAHLLIDAGADLIVGHHPHVLQGIEKYKGKYIAYSLGNFAFGGNTVDKNPHTVILRAWIGMTSGKPEISNISVVPCHATSSGNSTNNYRPVPLFGKEGDKTADYLLSLCKKIGGGLTEIARSGI